MKKLPCTSFKGASYVPDFKTRVGWYADRCASIKATSIDAPFTGITQGTCDDLNGQRGSQSSSALSPCTCYQPIDYPRLFPCGSYARCFLTATRMSRSTSSLHRLKEAARDWAFSRPFDCVWSSA
jgi:hypothetical protein